MRITLLLQDKKGKYLHHEVREFPEIYSMSDAAQRLPLYALIWHELVFGFSRLGPEESAVFRLREIIKCA